MIDYLETVDFMDDFARGERRAFNELYNQYFSRIYFSVIKIITNREEAKDITVGSFNKLFQKNADFNNLPDIRSFLYISARNACFNYIRQLRRITEKQQAFIATYPDAEEAVNDEIEGELVHALYQALEQLPSESRKVIELMYLHGLKYKEVAARLHISVETVKSQRKYAISKLRAHLSTTHLLALMVMNTQPGLLSYWMSHIK
jgi:RNA polymerase sigma-70 factor (ECF subfamily)